jgi:hypothetical protein
MDVAPTIPANFRSGRERDMVRILDPDGNSEFCVINIIFPLHFYITSTPGDVDITALLHFYLDHVG